MAGPKCRYATTQIALDIQRQRRDPGTTDSSRLVLDLYNITSNDLDVFSTGGKHAIVIYILYVL